MYVVYITFYRGNKMPPFYIGYTDELKISKGYNGSVQSKRYKVLWRRERKDHPELFKTLILQLFETDVEAREREEFLHRFFDVANNPMFINMSIGMAKFGGAGENHSRGMLGKKKPPVTDETRQRMRESHIGQVAWNSGKKTGPLPEWVREKMRGKRGPLKKKRVPFSSEYKQRSSLSRRGENNSFFGKRHSEETIQLLRKPKATLTCPHCGFVGRGPSNMYRYHFDNCRIVCDSPRFFGS